MKTTARRTARRRRTATATATAAASSSPRRRGRWLRLHARMSGRRAQTLRALPCAGAPQWRGHQVYRHVRHGATRRPRRRRTTATTTRTRTARRRRTATATTMMAGRRRRARTEAEATRAKSAWKAKSGVGHRRARAFRYIAFVENGRKSIGTFDTAVEAAVARAPPRGGSRHSARRRRRRRGRRRRRWRRWRPARRARKDRIKASLELATTIAPRRRSADGGLDRRRIREANAFGRARTPCELPEQRRSHSSRARGTAAG